MLHVHVPVPIIHKCKAVHVGDSFDTPYSVLILANLSSGSIISGRSNGGSQVLWPYPSYLGTGRVGSLPTYRFESTSKIYIPKNIN